MCLALLKWVYFYCQVGRSKVKVRSAKNIVKKTLFSVHILKTRTFEIELQLYRRLSESLGRFESHILYHFFVEITNRGGGLTKEFVMFYQYCFWSNIHSDSEISQSKRWTCNWKIIYNKRTSRDNSRILIQKIFETRDC